MKAYVSRKERHLKQLEKLQETELFSDGDYEEWRTHPCTQALFDYLEIYGIQALDRLVDGFSDPEVAYGNQRFTQGIVTVIDEIFNWKPNGVKLEEDDET